MIPILILAAGRSSRMGGRDKLLEDIDGEPLLRRQTKQALSLGGRVFVAIGPGQDARATAISDLDAEILVIPESHEGMSGTMRGAVARLPACKAFMLLLGDLVEINADDMRQIYEAYLAHPEHLIWRGATEDHKPGHPVIFSGTLKPEFAMLSGDEGGESLVNPLKQKTFLVPLSGKRARLDLDTPEDWEGWRATKR